MTEAADCCTGYPVPGYLVPGYLVHVPGHLDVDHGFDPFLQLRRTVRGFRWVVSGFLNLKSDFGLCIQIPVLKIDLL